MFEKEEVKRKNGGAYFFARAREEKSRSVHEAISALVKRQGAKMRDASEEATKETRAGFIDVINAALEESILKVKAKSELCRRRDIEEATSVSEDANRRRRDQEEE